MFNTEHYVLYTMTFAQMFLFSHSLFQGITYNSIKDGRIAVADSNNQCIQVFTLSGECKLR